MQFHHISNNSEHAFGLLSAAGAAAFLAVRNLIKGEDDDLGDDNGPTYHSTGTQSQPSSTQLNVLKLKNPEVNSFSGNLLDWNTWQVATLATLTSAGFDDVLNEDFDQEQTTDGPRKNRIVHSILMKACSD